MSTGEKDTIADHLRKSGVSRRNFLQLCSKIIVAAPIGLSLTHKATAAQVASIVGKARRPSVIWLHFQDCTGCTETLLRTSAPDVAHLILDVISLDYHETLMAASGAQAEAALALRDGRERGKVCAGRRRLDPNPGRRRLHGAERPAGHPSRKGSRGSGSGGDRHRIVRFLGRRPFCRSESYWSGRRRLRDLWKAHRQSARLPTESLQPAGGGARVRDHGPAP